MVTAPGSWLFVNTYVACYSVSLTIAVTMFLTGSVTIAGIKQEVADTPLAFSFTTNLHAIRPLLQLDADDPNHYYKLVLSVTSYLLLAGCIALMSLFGFCLLHWGSVKTNSLQNHNIIYVALVIAVSLTQGGIVLWATHEGRLVKGGVVERTMLNLQDRIAVDETRNKLNEEGKAFLEIQNEFSCCGVRSPYEWSQSVDWFSKKYGNVTRNYWIGRRRVMPKFPCLGPVAALAEKKYPSGCLRSNNEKSGAITPDCSLRMPHSAYGCGQVVASQVVDWLCRLIKLSTFYTLLQVFELLWLICLCHYYGVSLFHERETVSKGLSAGDESSISYVVLPELPVEEHDVPEKK